MSDALTPLRHAYGVQPLGAPLAPGEAGHPEQEALGQLRAVLDDWPVPSPSPRAVTAVAARASVVTALVEQTDHAVAQAVASRPRLAPSAEAVTAVLARAAEPSAPSASVAVPAESVAEAALIDQSAQALDRLPRLRPDAAVIAAIEARAASASADLVPIRALYLDGSAHDSAEAAVLAQSRTAIEQTLAARPQPRPSADAVAAILARAAEASGAEAEPVLDLPAVEAAVLGQSLRALDRLPRPSPSAATLDAVRRAAVTAGAAPSRETRPAGSPDRTPARPTRRRSPVGVWAGGAAAVLVAAMALFVVGPFGSSAEVGPVAVASLAETAEAPQAEPIAEAAPEVVEETAPSAPAPAASPGLIAASASGLAPAVQRVLREAVPQASAPSTPRPTATRPTATRPTAAAPPQVAAASRPAPTPNTPTPSWETSNDVRTLSLRLQELEADDALAWDDTPSETFGVPASASAGSSAGLQSVRAGAPAARARFRPDTSSVQR